jgi:hypothetical protein
MKSVGLITSRLGPDKLSYVMDISPFRLSEWAMVLDGELMKKPRQSFAEVACLYQNRAGKAMVFLWLGMGCCRSKRKWVCLTSFGSYGVLLGTGCEKNPSASLGSTASLQRLKE